MLPLCSLLYPLLQHFSIFYLFIYFLILNQTIDFKDKNVRNIYMLHAKFMLNSAQNHNSHKPAAVNFAYNAAMITYANTCICQYAVCTGSLFMNIRTVRSLICFSASLKP